MNIPKTLLTILDVVVLQSRVRLADHTTRRIRDVVEVVELDPVSKEIITNEVFRWDPKSDTFEYSGKSVLLDRIIQENGLTKEYMSKEFERRSSLLKYLASSGVRRVNEVGRVIRDYYADPEKAAEKVRLRLSV
jgi:flagellar protein FlaI